MRFRLAVLVAVTSFLTVVSPAAAGPRPATHTVAAAHTAADDWSFVQHELFGVSLAQILTDAVTGDQWFDWSTDYCSAPLLGDTGTSYNFRNSCRRHDFGYRNLRLLDRRYGAGAYWNHANRLRVDQRFLVDMRNHCATRAWFLKAACRNWADTYYAAVRWFGGP